MTGSGGSAPAEEEALINIARHLRAMAAARPDALALRVPRGRDGASGAIRYLDLTFAQLDRETDAWAHHITARGVQRGSRVLLLVTPGLSLIAVCFALFKAGAVPVVIDPGMGLRGFLRCVRHTAPSALVAIPRGILVSRVFRRAFAGVRSRVTVHPQRPLTLVARGSDRGTPTTPFPLAATRADELAAILFTSGSTGPAKGVCYEHAMFEAQVRLIRDTYGIAPGEVDLPLLPAFALFGPALGLTTVVPEIDPRRPATVDPAALVQAILECGVTNSFGAPVLWRKIVDHCLARGLTLPGLRRVLSAGAPVPPALMDDFRKVAPQAVLHSPYGATEALPVCTVDHREILDFGAERTRRGGGTCVGRSVMETSVRVIQLHDGAIAAWRDDLVLPAGVIGEVVVRGPQVTRAYDGLPAATRAAKIPTADGAVWHRMGDAGYLDEVGRLWFCGRLAERVRTAHGDRFTEQCEPIFNQHPWVARCALIGLGSPGAQEPAVVVEPKPGHYPRNAVSRLTFARALRALARDHETTRDITAFFFHRRLPVDVRHNAKIHRLALARRYARQRPLRVP